MTLSLWSWPWEIHNHTWFSVAGSSKLVMTRSGTRPGDPFADVIFNLLFAKILAKIKLQLQQEELLLQVAWSNQRHPFIGEVEPQCHVDLCETVWADDLALMIVAPDGESFCPRAQRTCSIAIDTISRYGLKINYSKGKTELIVSIRGRGSVQVRKKLFEHPNPSLEVLTNFEGQCQIRLVTSYKHLGGRITFAATDKQEMLQRLGHARSVFDQYKKKLFQSPAIQLETRTQLMTPFVLSIASFGMGTWVTYTKADEKKAAHRLLNMYKHLLRPNFDYTKVNEMSADEVIARTQLPDFATCLHIARLRHLAQILQHGPEILWAMIEIEQTWLSRLGESLDWLYNQLCSTINLPHPREDWQPWQDLICRQPSRWKNLLKRAQLHSILQQSTRWSNRFWHSLSMETAADGGLRAPWREKPVREIDPFHICAPCQMRFTTKSSWSVHMFRKHQRKAFVRHLSQSANCLLCCKNYWTATRLARHLSYSKRCAEYMAQRVLIQPCEPGIRSRHFNRNEPPTICPPVDEAVEIPEGRLLIQADPETEPDQEMLEKLFDVATEDISSEPHFGQTGTLWSCVEKFRLALISRPLPFSQIQLTWQALADDWKMLHDEDTSETIIAAWRGVFAAVDIWLSPAWLVPNRQRDTLAPERDAPYYWITNEAMSFDEQLRPKIPCLRCAERFVLHIFSGRRRYGDLQAWLEKTSWPPGTIVHIISLDIVFGENGDLLNSKARARWIALFKDALILAFYAGPPCETWSAAREVALTDSKVRPVRSALLPWGLDSMSIRETKQVAIANILMYLVVLLLVLQCCNGLFACMEHPSPSRKKHLASIWRTALWRYLRQLGIVEHEIFQGLFGALSPKPTYFAFSVNVPNIGTIFRAHQSQDYLPQQTSIGKDSSGQFRTSSLKEYLSPLCEALASCLHAWQASVTLPEAQPCPAEVKDLVLSFEAFADAEMGPDYAPPKTRLINFA